MAKPKKVKRSRVKTLNKSQKTKQVPLQSTEATQIDEATFLDMKSYLSDGHKLNAKVISGSMEPVIMTGDLVEVEAVRVETLKMFDIILYWDGEKLICHYVWHLNRIPGAAGERVILTKKIGKGNPDFPVSEYKVLGRITNFSISWPRKLLELWRRGKVQ